MSDTPLRTPQPRNSAASRSAASHAPAHLIRSLRERHQTFCRTLAARLSAAARTAVEVRLLHVDSLRFQVFVDRLDNPTCLCAIRSDAFAERVLLEINPAILFPLIDRLLGGVQEETQAVRRPLTEIEQRIAAHLAGLALTELQTAWQELASSQLRLDGLETNPQQATQGWPAGERIVQLEFEIATQEAHGEMRLCLPLSIATILCPEPDESVERHQTLTASRPGADGAFDGQGSVVPIVAHLVESKLTASDVAELQLGDIITTAHDVASPLVIRVDGVPQFHARPGALEGRKAVQIEELLDPPAK